MQPSYSIIKTVVLDNLPNPNRELNNVTIKPVNSLKGENDYENKKYFKTEKEKNI